MYGPFFTGMSWIMPISNFNIILYSPTSTSVHIEVAMIFGGESGMILEFEDQEVLSDSRIYTYIIRQIYGFPNTIIRV